ncbi:MAG: DUF4129 domain-containing protein [Bacteroidetes bacterium HGW-Bacteroidetes-2]|jgi:hypothetical protein|nr:MAG: DUF4129 domain-containing protein [Bacteroidetes bacterium HGW-Bacteroidetes-2]
MQKILLILFLFSFNSSTIAQDSIVVPLKKEVLYDRDGEVNLLKFDQEKIESLKKNPDFDYSEKETEDNSWLKFKRWLWQIWSGFWSWLFGNYQGNSFLVFLVKIIPYIIIIGLVAFVVWVFYKLNIGANLLKSKAKPEVFFTDEEEIIKSKNIPELIEKAVLEKEYGLAVRYYYLLLLKKLAESEIITYEFDKTNSDYIKEITEEKIQVNFLKVTTIYDYIWYGNFTISETDFKKAQQIFNSLELQIPKRID